MNDMKNLQYDVHTS